MLSLPQAPMRKPFFLLDPHLTHPSKHDHHDALLQVHDALNDNIAANCVLASACVVSHRLRYYPKQAVIPAVPADTAKHRPQSKCDTRPMAHDGNQALRTPDAVTAASTEL